MTNPANGENPTTAPPPAYGAPQQGGYYPPTSGYGYPPTNHLPRPRKPYAAALILAAVGFVVEAASSFLYWPSQSYSLTMSRVAAATGGAGYLLLGAAAFVAVASTVRR